MSTDLSEQAINEALSGNWGKAIKINAQILLKNPQDINALNRLSRAYYEIGKCKKALNTTKKVLTIDPLNQIAQKCTIKYQYKKTIALNVSSQNIISFIEIPGKTKTFSLVNIGSEENLLSLCPGDQVNIKISAHRVTITNHNGKHIGKVPDNIAASIISQKNNQTPKVFIKSYSKGELKVFLHITTDEQTFPQT